MSIFVPTFDLYWNLCANFDKNGPKLLKNVFCEVLHKYIVFGVGRAPELWNEHFWSIEPAVRGF